MYHKFWKSALVLAALCGIASTPVTAAEVANQADATGTRGMVTSVVRLDEIIDGDTDWRFAGGKGTKATLEVLTDKPAAGEYALRFAAEMEDEKGSARLVKDFQDLELADVKAIRMKVKSETATSFGIVLVDGTGQTHQKKGNVLVADNQWHDLVIEPLKIAGGEHWGGANDGKWHGQPASLAITFNAGSDKVNRKPAISIVDIRAEAVQAGVAQVASFKSDFENNPPSPHLIRGD